MSKLIMGKFKDNNIELCRTTSMRAGDKTAALLLEKQIPFVKASKKIPFFRREEYHGAEQIYVISINPHRYGQARRVLDTLEIPYRKNLMLSNY